MKTMKNLLFVALAAMTISACQKEMEDPNARPLSGETVTFTASVDDAATKTAIHYVDGVESFKTLFTTMDLISVNGVKTESVVPSDDQTNISFWVEGVTGPYFAVTGAHDRGFDSETDTYTLQVSGTGSMQKYRTVADGEFVSYWTSADILAAYSDSEELRFQHMSTFYAIKIDKENSTFDSNIKNVYIRQGDGGYMAGDWKLSFEGEDHKPTLTPGTLSAYMGYDCGDKGVCQDSTMIIGIPAYNYSEGLIFTIKDVNGNFASYKIPASATNHEADGGKIIPFKPAFKPASGTINSVEDWEDFAAAINSGKDWNLYRWVGNGTVKLGANIEAENLTTITKDFPYIFDGGGFTITRTNATKPLFLELSGEIKQLTLAGNLTLSDHGAPFVKNLNAGAKITDCTNEMDVTFTFSDNTTYVAGFAAVLPTTQEDGNVTTLTNCLNKGDITGETSYSQDKPGPYNVAIGGVVGDVRAGGSGAVAYKVIMTNCDNNGTIKFTPKPSDAASTAGRNLIASMGLTGIGGVAGTLRASKSIEMNDCDNTGNITLSAAGMTNENGMRPYAICLGGVIGCGTNQSGMGVNLNGHEITLTDCDNEGLLYNCGDNYSATSRGNNKVYTGGLAGALVGLESKYATVKTCSNTGNVITYDLCSDDDPAPSVVSVRSAYNAVAGGLIGFGGWVDMDGCTVNCQIGNGKRQMVSWGGMIGYTVRPFKVQNNTTLTLGGYFQRISAYNMNRAIVAVVPAATEDDSLTPTVSGSTISGTLSVTACMALTGKNTGCIITTSSYPTGSVTTNIAANTTGYAPTTALTSGGNTSLVNGKGTYSGVTYNATVNFSAAQ